MTFSLAVFNAGSAEAVRKGDFIRYVVTTDSGAASITWYDHFNDQQQNPDMKTPAVISFQAKEEHPIAVVTAQTFGEFVSCTLYINGGFVDSEEAFGQSAVATCGPD
ncbi:hypothetical protein [Antrihabitans sp. YC2-6]|uniref:hypothetical protein n=1 Tax=Antrihabitans sp. YC2-6 TaxID=2799498 RepID=UPI0018F2C838|nr:hypothetical protein [Antrihabitans sp. YC2-6]MBJ8343169.1 hypothetical protein [Antrihabitans sp. YC2-6]